LLRRSPGPATAPRRRAPEQPPLDPEQLTRGEAALAAVLHQQHDLGSPEEPVSLGFQALDRCPVARRLREGSEHVAAREARLVARESVRATKATRQTLVLEIVACGRTCRPAEDAA
jgi:hypothetical protein